MGTGSPAVEGARCHGRHRAPSSGGEVRLAVVLYGGVSLAIYMYGVTEELLRLVRATAGGDHPSNECEPGDTGAVYRDLSELLGGKRFVVDLISGTSAGGINGIALAKALVRGKDVEDYRSLRKVWVEAADFDALIDDESGAERRRKLREGLGLIGDSAHRSASVEDDAPAARSLLSGDFMTELLLGQLRRLDAKDDGYPLVDELDLYVTTTDLLGLLMPIKLADGIVHERRHGNHFRFHFDRAHDDFGPANTEFLAYAARCSAAFPFAFEPMLLGDLAPEPRPEWRAFYPEYSDGDEPPFSERPFSDGGILDNRPFTYITQSLLRRRQIGPDRKLIFVEPHPVDELDPDGDPTKLTATERRSRGHTARPNAIKTALAATLGIRGVDPIRADIQALLARNRALERLSDVVHDTGRPPRRWRRGQKVDRRGPTYPIYHQLRVRALVDHLSAVVAGAAGLSASSDETFAVHYLVRAWKESNYGNAAASVPVPELRMHGSGKLPGDDAFLSDYDLPYERRRLRFVLEQLDADLRLARARSDSGSPGDDRRPNAPLERLQRALTAAHAELGSVEEELSTYGPRNPLLPLLRGVGIHRGSLAEVLKEATDSKMTLKATQLLCAGPEPAKLIADTLRCRYSEALSSARRRCRELLDPSTADGDHIAKVVIQCLAAYYRSFEVYDTVLFPIEFGTDLGERDQVEIARVSPSDAKAWNPQPREKGWGAVRELKGTRLNHFGAFLDPSWRQHDIVWGRLDGAERLIRTVLPHDHASACSLIKRAHEAILWEECRRLHGDAPTGTADESYQWFRTKYVPKRWPSAGRMRALLGRVMTVLIEVVEGALTEREHRSAPVWRALGRASRGPGRIRAGFRLAYELARHWRWARWFLVALVAAVVLGLLAAGVLVAPTGLSQRLRASPAVWAFLGVLGGITSVVVGLPLLLRRALPEAARKLIERSTKSKGADG